MHLKHALPAAAALTASLASAQDATDAPNITSLINSNSNLSALASLLSSNLNLTYSLTNQTNITLFAPSNAALDALNSSGSMQTQSLLTQSDFMQALLNYHVVRGRLYSSNFSTSPKFLHTSLSEKVYSNVTRGQVVECRLEGMEAQVVSGLKSVANVTETNLNITGGVVHIIDSLLSIPGNLSSVAQNANLTAFLGALNATTNLTSTLNSASDITIFAPSNSAFQDIASGLSNLTTANLTDILSYHVINDTIAYSSELSNTTLPTLGGSNLTITISNGTVFVNSARVVNSDILLGGGVLHIIDSVLNPNNATNTTTSSSDSDAAAAGAFSGASSASTVPFTSGVPTPTTTIVDLVTSTTQVAVSFTPTGGATAAASSSTKKGAAARETGAVGAAALFGGAALLVNM